jgi:AmiR/NasT family two-component response regulator
VHSELADDAPTQAQLQRFIRPMVACVALEQRLKVKADQARDAVAAIERMAVVDLATGIVMARRDCDPQTARNLLTEWSSQEGFDLLSLTAADVLEYLIQP